MSRHDSWGSWGCYPAAQHSAVALGAGEIDLAALAREQTVLPYGQGRSYGDSCLNDGGQVLATAAMNHFLDFDRARGVLRCEAGVTLEQILKLIVPQGWFLPVTPGTKFVSVGGAIANDVHGKNHHRVGSFGNHVLRFELARSDGSRRVCTPQQHGDWFRATVGGLGLTGLITWAEIQLKPIHNAWLDVETLKFGNLEEFFAIARASEADYEYTVAWVDCLARGRKLGRGLFMRANAAPVIMDREPTFPSQRHLSVPFNAPEWVLNPLSVRAFNTVYFHRQRQASTHARVHYDPFFYPLDAIHHWNRIYGRRGFVQYQCVVDGEGGPRAIKSILTEIARAGQGSFLSVLKTFGAIPSLGMLSFPRAGTTLALDFPFRGKDTLRLLERLDAITRAHGGAVYPAKDARMSASNFQRYYPQWRQFSAFIDPRFSSSFWRRVAPTPVKEHHEEDTHRWRDLGDRAGNVQALRR